MNSSYQPLRLISTRRANDELILPTPTANINQESEWGTHGELTLPTPTANINQDSEWGTHPTNYYG